MSEPEFVELIREREGEILLFSKKLENFRSDLSKKLSGVRGLLRDLESNKDSIKEVSFYNPESEDKLARALAYYVLWSGITCVISPIISA